MNTNIERLSQMLKRHFHFWTEVFKDEETSEDVSIERRDILDTELSDEERQLIKAIAADIPNLTDEELLRFQEEISYFDCRTEEQIYIERVRRGEESMAEFIEGVPTLRELCDKDIYGEWHHVLAAALAQASADGDKVDDTQTRLMESLAGGYTRLADETARATQRCHELANDVERQSNDLREKDSRIQELEGELAAERAKVARFDTSISFKIGRAVTAPPRFIRDHLARHR